MKSTSLNIYLSIILFLGVAVNLDAQKKSRSNTDENTELSSGKIEIGYNVTTVLSHFIGNESLIEASDFPLIVRFRAKKTLFRIGLGVSGNSNEFFDNITGIFRKNDFNETFLKLGFEKEFFKDKKWTGYYGIDLIGNYISDQVTTFGFEQVILNNNTIGVGGGPFLGIKYDINSRIYFHTESTLYFLAKRTTLKQNINGVSTQIQETDNYSASLQSPLSLYLNYKFGS